MSMSVHKPDLHKDNTPVHKITAKYESLGGKNGFLGAPLTDINRCSDGVGQYQHFEGGSIYLRLPSENAKEVHGAIRDLWSSLGWEKGFLGYPITSEMSESDGIGRHSLFQGGFIYWSPSTGAHEVHGAILSLWRFLGWEKSFLGYPVTNETTTADGVGRFNHFQGGSIFWSPSTGAFEVHGAIRDLWASLGWERSFLGYPVTNETTTADGVGRFNHFQGGSIFWSPFSGAHEVHGAIRDLWASLGWEGSFLGYPISDESNIPINQSENGLALRVSLFYNGYICWVSKQSGDYVYALSNKETIYEIKVVTGNIDSAGTDAKVYIEPYGAPAFFGTHVLDHSVAAESQSNPDKFEKGETNNFNVIGPSMYWIKGVIIYHDNSGVKPGWFLSNISIRNTESNEKWNFPCNRWLSTGDNDGAIKLGLEPPYSPTPYFDYGPPPKGNDKTPPLIQVTASNGGTFVVEGSGFLANVSITIRVVDDTLAQRVFTSSSDKSGLLNATLKFYCVGGLTLHFSATDGRSNSGDVTGELWSNTVHVTCVN